MANLHKTIFTLLMLLMVSMAFAQSAIEVSGSNFPANGTYTPDGTKNGKTYYRGPVVTHQYSIEWSSEHGIWILLATTGANPISFFNVAVDTSEPPTSGWVAGGPIGLNFSFYTLPTFTDASLGPDEDAPVIASLTPSNGATDVNPLSTFSVEFDEDVKKGTGNINVYKASGELLSAIDINSTTNSIAISGTTLSFQILGLTSEEDFYILVDNGAILDISDNAFELTDSSVWTFTTMEIAVTISGAGNTNFDGKYIAAGVESGKQSFVKGDYRVRYESSLLSWIIENIADESEGIYVSGGVSNLNELAPHDVGWEPYAATNTGLPKLYKTPAAAPGPELSGYVLKKGLTHRLTYPSKDFADFPLNGVIEIRFNKEIQKGTGEIQINLDYGTTNFETFDVTGSNVTISGKSLFIDPVNEFTTNQRYNIIFASGVVKDLDGNDWAGIPTWNAGGIVFRARSAEITVEGAGMRDFNASLVKSSGTYSTPGGSGVYLFKNGNRWVLERYANSLYHFTYVNYSNTTLPPATGWEPMALGDLPSRAYATLRAPDPAPTLKGAVEAYVSAADVTWDGSEWSNGAGPSATDVVQINGTLDNLSEDLTVKDLYVFNQAQLIVSNNKTLTVSGNVINNGKLIIESGSSLLTASGTQIFGDVIIKRNTRYGDGKYSFVGTPVKTSNITTGYDIGKYVYAYKESTAFGEDGLNRWEDAAATTLVPGVGYAQAGQQEIIFKGIPNTGTITVTGTYTEDTDNAYEGWNMVANPYPAALNVTEFLKDNTNTTGALYIWDDNGSDLTRGSNSDYIVVNASGATDNNSANGDNSSRFNDHLGTTQGFFVQLQNATNTDIVFNEDQRVASSNEDDHFFRSSNDLLGRLRLNLSDESGLFKQTLIAWNDEVDDSQINFMYDAAMFNPSADYAIYTYKLGQPLAIQTVTPEIATISVGMNVATAGEYTLTADLNEFDSPVLLKDLKTGDVFDLSLSPYHFYASSGSLTDRFELLFQKSILNARIRQEPSVYATGKSLKLIPKAGEEQTFTLFSISGQYLLKKTIHQSETVDLSHFKAGIYLVTDGQRTTKIILK
ncbi:MAG: Ig-like domain-containing protein [Cyclobacteriaceae bacterium]